MIIRPAEPEDKQCWDDFVAAKPESTPYHLFAWKIAVEKSYGHKCIYLMARENQKLLGVLPLILIKPPLGKSCLVSLPFCDTGGVLAESPEIGGQLIAHALEKAQKAGAATVELRLQQEDISLENHKIPTSVSSHKVRMLLDLPASSDKLWKTFKSKLRSQIRKAEKNNLTFQWGTVETAKDFYNVFSINMRDLGSPVHARKFFTAILEAYGTNARLGLVSLDNQVIGGGIILADNKKVCVPWASTLRTHNRLAPNMLLYWNFLRYAADAGFTLFDFGRSSPGESTFNFKKQWGAEPALLYWYTFHVDGSSVMVDKEGGSLRSKAEMVWQNLPLPLANYLGPRIRKYISL